MNDLQEKNLRIYSGFAVTPEGWDETTVGQICDLGRGRVISQDEINEKPGPFPVFSSQTRNNGEMGRIATFDFSGEHVTWTTDGENAGTVFFRDGQFNCTNVCGTLHPKSSSDLDLRFLAHHLGRIAKRYVSYIGNPKLMNGVMASVGLVLPPQKQQRRIAEILGTVDEAIEQTEALVAKYQQLKAGLMHDLFTRGVTPDGQLRPTRQSAPHLYQNSPLGWIPIEWEVKPLSSFTKHDITYGIVQAGPHIEGGVPYVRTGDMSGNRLIKEQMLCTSRLIADSYKRSEIRSGEIVCAIRATVGKVLLAPDELDGANLTQGTARISPNSNTNTAFLLWAIRSERAQRSISLAIKGTTFMEITLGDLRLLPLAAPVSIAEQKIMGERLNECDSSIEAEESQLTKLRAQKQGLMQDLLTGRVTVKITVN